MCVLVVCLLSYSPIWSVCDVGVVPYADAVVAVTVMHVLVYVVACVYAERV